MSDHFDEEQELREAGSAAWDEPSLRENVRSDVLARSTSTLRRRGRRPGWLVGGAALVTAYAAGLATMVFLPSATKRPTDSEIAVRIAPDNAPTERIAIDATMVHGAIDPEALSLALLEMEPSQQVELLRQAGNWYLYEAKDIGAATGCYKRMLAIVREQDSVEWPEGSSWLLASLVE